MLDREMNDEVKVYRAHVSPWVVAIFLLVPLVLTLCAAGLIPWWVIVAVDGFFACMLYASLKGTWYAIKNGKLVVCRYFRPIWIPISGIRSVRYCTGINVLSELSFRCLSITFTGEVDYKQPPYHIVRAGWPINICPADRDGLVRDLLEINPQIWVWK